MSGTVKLWVVLACLAACAGSSPPPSATATASTHSTPEATNDAATRYRRGDYVIYRYRDRSGLNVLLEETIERVEGNRLWIHVVARRGAEQREWIQVVTDTPENRDANIVDELIEIQGDTRIPLANEGNRDMFRLYRWTLPPCGSPHDPAAPVTRSVSVADGECDATCVSFGLECGHAPARLEACDCDEFLWTHATAAVWIAGDDDPIWEVDVVAQGNDDPPVTGRLPRPEWLEP